MSELTIEQRVQAGGVQWMDAYAPDWWRRTNLDELDMTNPHCCILGQEFGSFWHVPPLAKYAEDGPFGDDELREVLAWAVPLGFDAGDLEDRAAITALTAEWRRVIESRRAES